MEVAKFYEIVLGLTSQKASKPTRQKPKLFYFSSLYLYLFLYSYFPLNVLLPFATLCALYILRLLASGQPVGADAAASWGITFQLTRFSFIPPCNKMSNQTDPI
jgi:hypothetical protein